MTQWTKHSKWSLSRNSFVEHKFIAATQFWVQFLHAMNHSFISHSLRWMTYRTCVCVWVTACLENRFCGKCYFGEWLLNIDGFVYACVASMMCSTESLAEWNPNGWLLLCIRFVYFTRSAHVLVAFVYVRWVHVCVRETARKYIVNVESGNIFCKSKRTNSTHQNDECQCNMVFGRVKFSCLEYYHSAWTVYFCLVFLTNSTIFFVQINSKKKNSC